MTWPARIGLFQFRKCGILLLEPVRARIGVYPEAGGVGSVQQKSQDASGYDDGYRSYLEEK